MTRPTAGPEEVAGDELAVRRMGRRGPACSTVPVADESPEFMRGLEVGVIFGVLACLQPDEYSAVVQVSNLAIFQRTADHFGMVLSAEIEEDSQTALVTFARAPGA